jgi:hypothetical protein
MVARRALAIHFSAILKALEILEVVAEAVGAIKISKGSHSSKPL